MIRIDKDIAEVQGHKLVIESELSSLVGGLLTQNILTKEEIESAVRIGLTPMEDLEKDLEKGLKERGIDKQEFEKFVENIKKEVLK